MFNIFDKSEPPKFHLVKKVHYGQIKKNQIIGIIGRTGFHISVNCDVMVG